MRHIKPDNMGVSLVVILPLLWKGITSQVIYTPGFSIQVSSSVSVQEGLCVTIPCSFTFDGRNIFRNSFGYWIRMPQNSDYIVATNDNSSVVQKTNFHLTGNPDTGDCTLTITDARREDEGDYYFRFEESIDIIFEDITMIYNYNREMTTTITVTDLSEEPVISDLGTVTAGIEKTVTCSPPGNCYTTAFIFQWKKSDVPGIWKSSSTVTFTPSLDDHQKTITCEMTNSEGKTTQKTIVLHVSYPPRNMEITIHSSKGEERPASPQVDIDQTETLTLVCRADGNPPVTVVWMKGGDDAETSIMSDNGLLAMINVTSSVSDVYQCLAWNALGLREQRIQVGTKHDLSEEPVISDLGTLTAGIEKTVTCAPPGNCSETSLVFQWKKSDVPGIWKNSSTVTFTPSPDDHQKNITCEMTNSKGKTTQKTILLDVYYPPRNMEITIHSLKDEERPASPQVDIDQSETLTLVCRADGNPPVTVVWMRGEDDTDTSMSNSGLSTVINVTSSMSDVYQCLAWNALGLRERRIQVGTKHDGCMDSTIIIGMVVGNIVLLILIIVGSYFFLKRRMEKRLLGQRYPDPGAQETEST